MRSIFSFLLSVLILVSIVGCSKENAGDNQNSPQGSGQSQGTEPEDKLQVRGTVFTVASINGQYLVVKEDGSLWGWGNNESCQITYLTNRTGKGEELVEAIYEPQHIMDNVVSVGAGECYSMALKEDGTLWVWGTSFTDGCGDLYGKPDLEKKKAYCTPRQILDDVVSFSAGHRHFLAIRSDGTLWAAGFNMYGQTDWTADNNDFVSTPKQLMTDCAAAAAGADQSYCIKTDGTLWSWGSGYHGVMGSSKAKRQGFNAPVKVMDDVVCVAAGAQEGYAVKSDNTLWGWGCGISYLSSKCPCFDSNEKFLPQKLMDDVDTVSASLLGSHVLARKADGTVWGRGTAGAQYINTTEISNHFGYYAKDMSTVQDYNKTTNFAHSMVKLPISNIVHVVAGAYCSLLVTDDGELIGCGGDAVRAYSSMSQVVYYKEDGFYGPLLTDVRLP